MRLLESIRRRLCDDARHWYLRASNQLAAIAGLIAGWQALYPDEYKQIVEFLPEAARPFVGVAVTACAILSREWKQPKLEDKRNGT